MFEELRKPQVVQRPVNTVRMVAISDLHNKFRHLTIPRCDLLVCAGDITNLGEYADVQDFNIWAARLQETGLVKQVVTIAGNHDLSAESDPDTFRQLLPDVTYLCEESYEYRGLKIYGTPYSPRFGRNWAFQATRGLEAQQRWEKIPEGLDVLIVHGPPYGVLDVTEYKVSTHEHVGCWDLRQAILEKKPRVVVCGHIHEGYGMSMLGNTLILNAAVNTLHHQPINRPLVLDL